MKLLVGLGNPGNKHARNRHNVGFRVIEAIWQHNSGDAWRSRFQGECAEIRLNNEKCLLLKPQTYMNLSGNAVGAAMQFYKLQQKDIIIFYDEIDLIPGKLRIKTGGGAAGHNGLRSISSQIGSDYVRVRIGVGHPGAKDLVAHYVLHDFAKSDEEWLNPLIDTLAASGDKIVGGNYSDVMNDVARAVRAVMTDEDDDKARPAKPKVTTKTGPKAQTDKTPDSDKKQGGALADKLRGWLDGNKD